VEVLREAGATRVSAYVAHAAFPGESYKQFYRGGRTQQHLTWTYNVRVVRVVMFIYYVSLLCFCCVSLLCFSIMFLYHVSLSCFSVVFLCCIYLFVVGTYG